MKPEIIVKQLLKRPIKENALETPHYQDLGKNKTQQADLLFITNDKGFKYILVVVDLGSRLCDATPLKTKTASATRNGFKKIYAREILKMPNIIELDPGGEFKSVTREYFEDNGCFVKYGNTARSRQQALAERYNQHIGNEIMLRQLIKEVKTNKINKEWIKDLPEIVRDLNKRYEVKKPRKPKYDEPIFTRRNSELLSEGTKVRIIIEKPVDYFGNKLPGKFRSADIRWSPKIHKIDFLILRPNFPPMYHVNNTAYTRGQLQPV